ncbi:YraN family protein [bacterium]|nr:YraN family protein [bacterium]
MPKHPVEKGRIGEGVARSFLERKGYEIIAYNYRKRGGEIDIVSRYENTIIFVEVKTDYSSLDENPAEWLDEAQQKRIMDTAEKYLVENKVEFERIRFDVIILIKQGGLFEIKHYEDAFSPGLVEDEDLY